MPSIVFALFRFLSHWPLWLLHAVGAGLGQLIYVLSPTYRRHLKENLFLAVGESRGRQVLSQSIAAAGRGLMELPAVWFRPQAEAIQLVTRISGIELVTDAKARGEAIVFITPHLGCFEISAHYCAQFVPMTVLYRAAKKPWVQQLMEAGRGCGKLKLAPADLSGVRNLLKALKRGEAVGMLPDQVPGAGEGMAADFFGKPAWTMTLAARLVAVKDVCVIFAYAERLPRGAGFHLHLLPPSQPLTGSLEERVLAINRELEILIRACPEQYLWGYNRYKNMPPAEAAARTGPGAEGAEG